MDTGGPMLTVSFDRNGPIRRVAYGWWKSESELKAPKRVNGCELFWLTLFSIFLAWPAIFTARAFSWVLRIVGAVPAIILFGYFPAGRSWKFDPEKSPLPFVPMKAFATRNGTQIMPIGVLLGVLMLVGLLIMVLQVVYYGLFKFLFVEKVLGTTLGRIGLATVLTVAVSFISVSVVRNSEVWRLVKTFVKAKKEKYCPIVEFK